MLFLADGRFWFGLAVGVALFWGYLKWQAKRAAS